MEKEINSNYSVTTEGVVLSKPRVGTAGGRLTPIVTRNGYLTVMLSPSRRPVEDTLIKFQYRYTDVGDQEVWEYGLAYDKLLESIHEFFESLE